MTRPQLEKLIGAFAEGNLFYAVRVDGLFASVTTRTVRRQKKPYPKLAEATAKDQANDASNLHGTLAGFVSPPYAETIAGPNYYLHFIRDDRLAGGHALDYVLTKGRLSIAPQHGLHIELPTTSEFERSDLSDPSLADEIRGAESRPTA